MPTPLLQILDVPKASGLFLTLFRKRVVLNDTFFQGGKPLDDQRPDKPPAEPPGKPPRPIDDPKPGEPPVEPPGRPPRPIDDPKPDKPPLRRRRPGALVEPESDIQAQKIELLQH